MVKCIAVVVIASALAGCAHAKGSVGVPADAEQVVSRLGACTHFAGEINGDRSERDRQVYAAMTELRCETIDQDVLVIRNKYPNNQAVQGALDAAGQP
jgi:hypothetical protein